VAIGLIIALIVGIPAIQRVSVLADPDCPGLQDSSIFPCSVPYDLRDAFSLAERLAVVVESTEGSRMAALAREGHVRVEWYPDSVVPGFNTYGRYLSRTRVIWAAPTLRDEPLRVRATVLVHELAHATWDIDHLGAELAPLEACIENEARAYRWSIRVYAEALRASVEPAPPAGTLDGLLAERLDLWRRLSGGGQLTSRALDDLARDFVLNNGYAQDCAWLAEAGAVS
jgi:hypothetical protein